jgi:hypothetical protein
MWRPFVPPSLRKGGLFDKVDVDDSPFVALDPVKDVAAWVRRHFRRFRLEGPKKLLPKWVYNFLVKLYGSAIEEGQIADLAGELDGRIKEFIKDVVKMGMRDHQTAIQFNDDESKVKVVAHLGDKRESRALHRSWKAIQDTLQLHGFYGIIPKQTKPRENMVLLLLDLTRLQVEVRSVAVWLLLHSYRQSPILWDGDVWVPEEVPDNADTAAQHLL